MRVAVCTDAEPLADGTCAAVAWLEQPTLLPPLSSAEGLVLSGYLITAMATAWGWNFLRRFIAPKTG